MLFGWTIFDRETNDYSLHNKQLLLLSFSSSIFEVRVLHWTHIPDTFEIVTLKMIIPILFIAIWNQIAHPPKKWIRISYMVRFSGLEMDARVDRKISRIKYGYYCFQNFFSCDAQCIDLCMCLIHIQVFARIWFAVLSHLVRFARLFVCSFIRFLF